MGRYLIRVNAFLVFVAAVAALTVGRWLIALAVAAVACGIFLVGEVVGKREHR